MAIDRVLLVLALLSVVAQGCSSCGVELFRGPVSFSSELRDCDLLAIEERLAGGADPNDTGDYQGGDAIRERPLIEVVGCAPEVTQVLLDAGADPNLGDHQAWKPAERAAELGEAAVLDLLLEGGAEAGWINNSGNSLAHAAIWRSFWQDRDDAVVRDRPVEILTVLAEHGAPLNQVNEYGYNPLYYAVQLGDADAVRLLLDAGVAVDVASERDPTDLYWAIGLDRPDLVEVLLAHGADPNRQASASILDLGLFIYSLDFDDQLAVVETLGPHMGVEVEIIEAFEPGDVMDGATLLRATDVDIVETRYVVTPLYAAVAVGDQEIVDALVTAGADPDLGLTSDGHSPAQAAVDLGRGALFGSYGGGE